MSHRSAVNRSCKKTHVNLGEAFNDWMKLMDDLNLKRHDHLANLLLSSYYKDKELADSTHLLSRKRKAVEEAQTPTSLSTNSTVLNLSSKVVKSSDWRESLADHLIREQSKPIVFKNLTSTWEASQWSPETLLDVFGSDFSFKFRIGPKETREAVIWEADCCYEEATLLDYVQWLRGSTTQDNPLHKYSGDLFWCYADYKYLGILLAKRPDILKAIDWSILGFNGRDGEASTFWMGSNGSFTPAHYDTYGCNLVAQVYGRKRWILYPPEDTPYLYPTRIPYEESSIFSEVNISNLDMKKHWKFQFAKPYIVTLEPGDILFVPPKWWHYVESLDATISINTWIEVESDRQTQVEEALVKLIVSSLKKTEDPAMWLNPTESLSSNEENYELVRKAVKAMKESVKEMKDVKEMKEMEEVKAMKEMKDIKAMEEMKTVKEMEEVKEMKVSLAGNTVRGLTSKCGCKEGLICPLPPASLLLYPSTFKDVASLYEQQSAIECLIDDQNSDIGEAGRIRDTSNRETEAIMNVDDIGEEGRIRDASPRETEAIMNVDDIGEAGRISDNSPKETEDIMSVNDIGEAGRIRDTSSRETETINDKDIVNSIVHPKVISLIRENIIKILE